LPISMMGERTYGEHRQVQTAAALFAFWFNKPDLFALALKGLPDGQRPSIQINVLPSQAEQLTEPQTRCDGGAEERL
jgi:hypothetical protein